MNAITSTGPENRPRDFTSGQEPVPNGDIDLPVGASHVPASPAIPVLSGTGAATVSPDAPAAPIECTLIVSDGPATKSYSVDAAGKPVKSGEPSLSSGTAGPFPLPRTAPLTGLAAALGNLKPRMVLTPGRLLATGAELRLTTKARLASEPGAITRTPEYLGYPAGCPALVMLDHDAKDLPAELRERLDAGGGLLDVLAALFPEFGRAGVLERPSVSTGIRNRDTGETTPGGGRHLWFVAEDGGDVARFVEDMHRRLVLAGWGFVFISKAGTAFVRSLIDVIASRDPSRLAYEADAVLDSPVLEHVPGARACKVHRDGVIFNTASVAPLTAAVAAQLATAEAELLAAAAPEIERVRAGVKQARAAALIAKGVPPAEAQARAARSFDTQRLDLDTVLRLDDGRTVAVAEILLDPAPYDGETCADPLEPGYGSGRNLAVVCVTAGRYVAIRSQAHGGQVFDVAWTTGDLIEAWNARHDPDEIARMYPGLRLDGPGDEAALAAAGVPAWAGLDFVSVVPVALPGSIPGGWERKIKRNDRGVPVPGLTNAVLALSDGCGLGAHLRWDVATNRMLVVGVPPTSTVALLLDLQSVVPAYIDPLTGIAAFQWTDAMLTTVRLYLETWDAGIASKDTARDAVTMIAHRSSFSSVAAYLRGVQWDGIPRLDGWLVRHAGADDTPFSRVVLRMWMIAAVARARFPEERSGAAAQVDNVLTLVGEQAARKSSFFRQLCAVGAWHTENSLGDLTNKDAILRISSAWIVDMAEGGSVRASEVEAFKQFVTTTADNLRLPYDTAVTRLVRRNVFAMTVNRDGAGFLKDGTGNRRFWVVAVDYIDIEQLDRERDQLWAEAVSLFDAGGRWWFDRKDPRDVALEAEAAAAAEEHRAQTPAEELLRQYVEDAPVLEQRGRLTWTPRPAPLTVMRPLPDVLGELGLDGRHPCTQRDARRAMTAMGWTSTRINFRNSPVPHNQTVWVAREGAAAIRTDTRSEGSTVIFRRWLDAQAMAGAIGLREPTVAVAVADFAAHGDGGAA